MPITFDGDRGDPAALKRFYRNMTQAPWQRDAAAFLSDPINARRIGLLLEHLKAITPSMLIDVGCGNGTLAQIYSRTNPDSLVCGVDLNPSLPISFRQPAMIAADACALPLHAQCADCAVCSEMLEHLIDPVAALSEIHRILKPAGFLLVTIPNLFCLDSLEGRVHMFETLGQALHKAGITSRWRNGINTHIQKLTPQNWADMLTSNGFEIIDQQPVFAFPYIPYFFKSAKVAERFLFRVPGVSRAQRALDRGLRSAPLGQLHFFLCQVSGASARKPVRRDFL